MAGRIWKNGQLAINCTTSGLLEIVKETGTFKAGSDLPTRLSLGNLPLDIDIFAFFAQNPKSNNPSILLSLASENAGRKPSSYNNINSNFVGSSGVKSVKALPRGAGKFIASTFPNGNFLSGPSYAYGGTDKDLFLAQSTTEKKSNRVLRRFNVVNIATRKVTEVASLPYYIGHYFQIFTGPNGKLWAVLHNDTSPRDKPNKGNFTVWVSDAKVGKFKRVSSFSMPVVNEKTSSDGGVYLIGNGETGPLDLLLNDDTSSGSKAVLHRRILEK